MPPLTKAGDPVRPAELPDYHENEPVIIPYYAPQYRDWFRMTVHIINGRLKWCWALTAMAMEELEKRIADIKKWFDAG